MQAAVLDYRQGCKEGRKGTLKPFKLHFDGGCVPNPGRGYGSFEIKAGFQLRGGFDWSLRKERIDFGDGFTNNMAEYQALCCALESLFEACLYGVGPLAEKGIVRQQVDLTIYSDSRLLVGCLNNGWTIRKPHLRPLHECARCWLSQFGHWDIKWNPRQKNVERFGH